MDKPLKVAYLDDEDVGTSKQISRLEAIFARAGLKADILHFKNYDKDVKSKSGVFATSVVDIFITDILLGDSELAEGLTVAQEVKREHPDILVIGISGHDLSYVQTAQKVPSFDLFIHRSRMRNSAYINYIASKIRRLFRRNVHVALNVPASALTARWTRAPGIHQLNGMLRTVTFTSHDAPPSTAVKSVVLTPLDGGRSSSEVHRMTSVTSNGLECVSSVLKIDTIEKSLQELANYQAFVKWYLPYNWRTELIGAAQTKDWGCICYAFAHNPRSSYRSLTECIEAGDIEKVRVVIDSIFQPSNQRWYAKENHAQASGLTEYYDKKWFDGRADPSYVFEKCLRQFDATSPLHIRVHGRDYPYPRQFLLSEERDGYTECICHGDLHSGNILITNDRDIVFIDFQATGRGHVFEDFVAFESSIRTLYPRPKDLAELIEQEWEILNGLGEGRDEFEKLVLSLRQHAFDTFPEEPRVRYVYALALYSFRMLRSGWLDDGKIRQQVACLLSTMRYLQEHETREG